MVPRVELPPGMELTDQVTEVLVEPVTVGGKGETWNRRECWRWWERQRR